MRLKTSDPDFNYELACTEVCGRGHFAMRFLVVVDEPAEYKNWLASQKSWKSLNEDYFALTLKKVTATPKPTDTKARKDEYSSL